MDDDIDLHNIMNVVFYQKKLLLLIIITGIALSVFLSSFVETTYTSHSSILINNGDEIQTQNLKSVAKSFTLDIGFILTEIEILKSREMAKKVVTALDLENDPEFNPNLNKSGDLLEIKNPSQNTAINNDVSSETITNFLEALKVVPIVGSLVVKVSASSSNPEKAALISNTLVKEYMSQRVKGKVDTQANIAKWLDRRVNDLKERIRILEVEAEQYRIDNNITPDNNILLSTEELVALKNKRLKAEEDYLQIKSQLNEIQKSKDNILTIRIAPNILDTALVKDLNKQKLDIETDISELSSRYGPKHPTMIEKRDELEKINQKINEKVAQSIQALKSKVSSAKSQLNDIDRQISTATTKSNKDNVAVLKLRTLEREVETAHNALDTFYKKYKNPVNTDNFKFSGGEVISYATVPETPSSPNKTLIILLGSVFSIILGIITIFLNEKLSNAFRNTKDLEKEFDLPTLPSISYKRVGWNKNLVTQVLSDEASDITESIRNLRLALKDYKTDEGSNPKVISILSSLKNEGKTTLATLMASLAAKAGERVILVDTNLRQADIHGALEQDNHSDLVEYLTNQKELKDVIVKNKDTNLDVIYGSAVPNNAFNLLSMNKLDLLISALKQNYDLIILDTPACLEASDARLIEQLSDMALYCVKQNSTKKKSIEKAIKPLMRRENLAFVMTFVK